MMASDEVTRRRSGRAAQMAWAGFDWANSAFPTVILTFVFSAYFTQALAPDPATGTSRWGWAFSFSGILIALTSPFLGAVADQRGARKPWLAVLTGICILATASLWWAAPGMMPTILVLLVVVIANLGFEIGMVFYNAMLPGLVPPRRIGRLSGWAWGFGYAGGLVCLILLLFGFIQRSPPPFGLDPERFEHIRIVGPFVAAWFALFALPLFLLVPDRPRTGVTLPAAFRSGWRQLRQTILHARSYRNIVRFLIARLFYVDGLNTLFAFGGIYAAGTFGMAVDEIIMFGIVLNVTAGLGAFAFGWLDDRIGAKRTVLIALAAMMALGVPLLLVESKMAFWALATPLGLFMGPAQAASRSLMARLAPPELETEMFGLFALAGKVTAFLGPALVAAGTAASGSQRVGMAAVILLLLIGGAILMTVHEPAVRDE